MSMRRGSKFVFLLAFLSAFANAREWVQERPHPSITVIYPENEISAATLQDLRDSLPKIERDLTPLFGDFLDGGVTLVLDPRPASHNGLATVAPAKRVYIYVTPPYVLDSIGENRNWMSETALHELTHIAHMGLRRGFMKALYYTFGTIVTPNASLPTWLIEGLAVLHETRYSPAGRGRSSFLKMVVNEACREKLFGNPSFSSFDQLTSPTYPWPRGLRPYLIGYDFLTFVEKRVGAERFNAFHKATSGWFFYFWLFFSKGELGQSWSSLWREYVEWRNQSCKAPSAAPAPESTRLGSATWSPVLTKEGLFFSHSGKHDKGSVFFWPSSEKEPRREFSKDMTETSDLHHLAWDEKNQHLYYASSGALPWSDTSISRIYRYNRKNKKHQRVHSEQGTDPDVHPTRGLVTYVHQEAAGSGLRVLEIKKGAKPQWACPARQDTDFYQPRFHPQRDSIIVSAHTANRNFEIWECHLAQQKWTRLIHSSKLGFHSASLYGSQILLTQIASETEPEIVAYNEASQQLCRLTVEERFRFQPVADGNRFAAVTYGNQGFDVGRRSGALSLSPVCQRSDVPEAIPPPQPTPAVTTESYTPWRHLMPTFWLPVMYFSSELSGVGAVTAQWDPLFRHRYDLFAAYEFQPANPTGSFIYQYSPSPLFSTTTYLSSFNDAFFTSGDTLFQTTITASQSVGFRLSPGGAFTGGTGFLSEHRLSQDGLIPARNNAVMASIGYSETSSMSTAPTWTGLTWKSGNYFFHDLWGAESNFLRFHESVQWHYEMPWSHDHILKTHLTSGYVHVLGSNNASIPSGAGTFAAGGIFNFSTGTLPGSYLMRGYPLGAFRSRQLHVVNAGYAFPLMEIYRGWGISPFFFKFLAGEVVSDWLTGDFRSYDLWKDWFGSAGAELHLHWTFAYYTPLVLTSGVYYGFSDAAGGEFQWRTYLQIFL